MTFPSGGVAVATSLSLGRVHFMIETILQKIPLWSSQQQMLQAPVTGRSSVLPSVILHVTFKIFEGVQPQWNARYATVKAPESAEETRFLCKEGHFRVCSTDSNHGLLFVTAGTETEPSDELLSDIWPAANKPQITF